MNRQLTLHLPFSSKLKHNNRGNTNFRRLVEKFKPRYKKATKQEKPEIAQEVVKAWRAQEPPGRFLAKTDKGRPDSQWCDVGDLLAIKRATKTLGERPQRERRAQKAAMSVQRRLQVSASNDVGSEIQHAGKVVPSEEFHSGSPYDTTSFLNDDTFSMTSSTVDQDYCVDSYLRTKTAGFLLPPQPWQPCQTSSSAKPLHGGEGSVNGTFFQGFIRLKQEQYSDDGTAGNVSFQPSTCPQAEQTNSLVSAVDTSSVPTAAELVKGAFDDDH